MCWCMNMHSIYNVIKNKWYFYLNIKYGRIQIILLNKLLLQYHRCCFTSTKSQVLMRYIWDTYFIMLSCKFSFKSYICIPLNRAQAIIWESFSYKLHNWFKVYISFMILYYICVISLPNWDINKIYRCTCLLWFNGFLHLRKFQNQPICFSSICIIRKMLKLFSEVHTQQQRQENM